MAIKWEAVQPGDLLYEKRRQKTSGATTSREAIFQVRVLEIDHTKNRAKASWNGNAPITYLRRSIEKLYRNRPELKERFSFDRMNRSNQDAT